MDHDCNSLSGAAPADAPPVWLLDVDGVINASRPGWGGAPARAQLLADGQWWKLRWAPEVVDFVREVDMEGLAEVRWATTWVPWVRDIEVLWGLSQLALAFPADTTAPDDAKLPAALAVIEEEQRALVWTDDERIPVDGETRRVLDAAEQGSLLISPRSSRGLRPPDVKQIRRFLLDHRHERP